MENLRYNTKTDPYIYKVRKRTDSAYTYIIIMNFTYTKLLCNQRYIISDDLSPIHRKSSILSLFIV